MLCIVLQQLQRHALSERAACRDVEAPSFRHSALSVVDKAAYRTYIAGPNTGCRGACMLHLYQLPPHACEQEGETRFLFLFLFLVFAADSADSFLASEFSNRCCQQLNHNNVRPSDWNPICTFSKITSDAVIKRNETRTLI